MISWIFLMGGFAYIILGRIMNCVTARYLWELTDEVMAVYNDERYAKMLWYNIPVVDTKLNRVLVNIAFTSFWPVICIASVLKAEWNYDRVMRQNAFKRRVP